MHADSNYSIAFTLFQIRFEVRQAHPRLILFRINHDDKDGDEIYDLDNNKDNVQIHRRVSQKED